MEETIELKELFSIIKKRLLMIIMFGFLAAVISGAVSFFVLTPIFQTSTQLIVNNATEGNALTQGDIQASVNLINTYREIIRSPFIMEQVIDELNLNASVGEIQNSITVNSTNNSQVLTITVRHEDPAVARDVANTTASVFQENLGDLMNVENISVLAQADLRTTPVEPRPMMNMAIGAVVGVMIGVGLTFLLEYMDGKVKTEQDIKRLVDLPILGVVPWMSAEDFDKKA